MVSDVVHDAWRSLGRQLACLRRSSGLTQHAFAPMTMYGRSTVANAESGHQRVSRGFWVRCDELLRAEGQLVRRYDEIVAMERGLHRLGGEGGTSGPKRGIERRGALLMGIAAVAAASGLAKATGPASAARRVGAADVARIRAVTALYRSLDYEVGGGAIRRDVNRFAHVVTTLLNHGDVAAVREPLLTAVAEVRQLAVVGIVVSALVTVLGLACLRTPA
ncbi:hypothetical protein GCM10009557_85570 [Virgisporangium ochraceum]